MECPKFCPLPFNKKADDNKSRVGVNMELMVSILLVFYLRNELNFRRFIESWIIRVSCKVNVKPLGFTLILQETLSIHVSTNIPKIEFTAYIYVLS